MMRRLLLALSLALTSLGAAGCNEFHYYDIHLRYDDAMFATVTSTLVSRVRICHVYVTGADTNSSPTTNIGTFEFSTFADSGTLNFTIKTYVGTEFDSCMLGSGTKSYPATATTTTVDMPGGDDDLVINMRNPTVETTCPP
jgi:hypothetical protein